MSGPGASSIVGGPPREIVWPLHGVPGGLGSGKEPISRGRKVELGQSSHRGWEGGSRLLPPVGSGRLPPVESRLGGRAGGWAGELVAVAIQSERAANAAVRGE